MRRVLKICAISATAAVLCAGIASAEQRFDSHVTIKFSAASKGPPGANWFGKVKSEKNACEPQRKVTLYGRATENSDPEVLGSDKTNANGEWAVNDVSSDDSYYYAKAKERDISAGLCKADKSEQLNPG